MALVSEVLTDANGQRILPSVVNVLPFLLLWGQLPRRCPPLLHPQKV